MREVAIGTERRFAATQQFGRFRSEADICRAYRKRIYEYTALEQRVQGRLWNSQSIVE